MTDTTHHHKQWHQSDAKFGGVTPERWHVVRTADDLTIAVCYQECFADTILAALRAAPAADDMATIGTFDTVDGLLDALKSDAGSGAAPIEGLADAIAVIERDLVAQSKQDGEDRAYQPGSAYEKALRVMCAAFCAYQEAADERDLWEETYWDTRRIVDEELSPRIKAQERELVQLRKANEQLAAIGQSQFDELAKMTDRYGSSLSDALRKSNEVNTLFDDAEELRAELARVKGERDRAYERAAVACEARAQRRFDENGTTEYDTGAQYYGGRVEEEYNARDEEDHDCAADIRALAASTPAKEQTAAERQPVEGRG